MATRKKKTSDGLPTVRLHSGDLPPERTFVPLDAADGRVERPPAAPERDDDGGGEDDRIGPPEVEEVDPQAVRDNYRARLRELAELRLEVLKDVPHYVWIQGNASARSLYEAIYWFRDPWFASIVLNDVSIRGDMATLLKQVLEKDGERTVSWGRAAATDKGEKVAARFKTSARVVVIANRFAPSANEDWEAVLSRLLAVRFNPPPGEILNYMRHWFPQKSKEHRAVFAQIVEDYQDGKILALNLRTCGQAVKLLRAGASEQTWKGMIADAYQPSDLDEMTEDEAAILAHCSAANRRRFRKTEIYKALGRFKNHGKQVGGRLLDDALAELEARFAIRRIVKKEGADKKLPIDLYEVLSREEQAMMVKKKAAKEIAAQQNERTGT